MPAKGSKRGTLIEKIDPAGLQAAQPVVDLAGKLDGIAQLVAEADGSLLAADQVDVYRVAPDGTAQPVGPTAPLRGAIETLLPQPDGTLLVLDDKGGLTHVAQDRSSAPAKVRLEGKAPFASLADGTLVGAPGEGDATGDVALIDPAGGPQRTLIGRHPGLGDGDGGTPATMRATVGGAATTPEGGLLVLDAGQESSDATYLDTAGLRSGSRLRLLSPFGPTPPAAIAITPATFDAQRLRTVSFLSGGAGAVSLRVLRPHTSHVVATATGPAPGGLGELALTKALPPGPYDLRLAFAARDGSAAEAFAHVDTSTTLTLERARRIVNARRGQFGEDGEASFIAVGRCARRGARTVTCPIDEVSFGPRGHRQVLGRRCNLRETVRLARDGVHVADGRC